MTVNGQEARPVRAASAAGRFETGPAGQLFLNGCPGRPATFTRMLYTEVCAERCAACHSLHANKTGPLLGGVVGRLAGIVSGYNYSPALHGAGLRWSADALDQWLADPRKFISGARMPVRVLDPATRRDIIAYLEAQSRQARAGGSAIKRQWQGPSDH